MSVTELRDKGRLLRFLRRDPYLHIYSIGDLDDFFWPQTKWFGIEQRGELRSVFLLYSAPNLPVLLALEETDKEASRALLRELIPILPEKFYCHLTPGLSSVLQPFCRLESHGLYSKMRLRIECFKPSANLAGFSCRTLDVNLLPTIAAFYKSSYPDNWFDARMLETGKYVGVFTADTLIAVSGIHVYSKEYGVAALGNITTHPEFRRRGVGSIATGELCRRLTSDVTSIGLNVSAENAAAIRCYEKLGFEFHAPYEEHIAYKSH